MKTRDAKSQTSSYRTSRLVRHRIARGGERFWRMEDFDDQPLMAVAQILSRLSKAGVIERLSKGVYYKSRETPFGKSLPNPAALHQLVARHKSMFPAGLAAANFLGFTTQSPKRTELATNAFNLPRKLIGPDAIIHTRRPEAWTHLSETEAALLEFLRAGGKTSELSPQETQEKVLILLSEPHRYERLARAAATEPPRVRALLGAFGECLKKDSRLLEHLRSSLNPLSRFDFGMFSGLPNAKAWQAKEKKA